MIQTELGFNGCCEDRSGCQKGGCHQKGALGLIEELNPAGIDGLLQPLPAFCRPLVGMFSWKNDWGHSRTARDCHGLSMDHGLIWIISTDYHDYHCHDLSLGQALLKKNEARPFATSELPKPRNTGCAPIQLVDS